MFGQDYIIQTCSHSCLTDLIDRGYSNWSRISPECFSRPIINLTKTLRSLKPHVRINSRTHFCILVYLELAFSPTAGPTQLIQLKGFGGLEANGKEKNLFFSSVTTLFFIPPYEIVNRHSLHHFGPMCISFALVTPVFLEIASISTSSCLVSRSSRPGKRHTHYG